jgi:hypothetical protein
LNPERGLLFRITHRDNLPWLLANGVHCANGVRDPGFVPIGNPDLIDRRASFQVPIPPGGTLADYVPFYFTPKSPMLYNILSGWAGLKRRTNAEIVFIISSVSSMNKAEVRMLFTDRHAVMGAARWEHDPAKLATMIDWDILQRRDFARDDAYPDKKDRYQAEALAYRNVPVEALIGIACGSESAQAQIEALVGDLGLPIPVRARADWYFQ